MNQYRPSPFSSMPPVVKNLLIINVLFFIAKYALSSLQLDDYLAVYYFDSPGFKIWQIITYMFMHGGPLHIFFNMFALVTFGTQVEMVLGSKRFLNYYILTGIGAMVLQNIVQGIEVSSITGSFTNGHIISDVDIVNKTARVSSLLGEADQQKLMANYLFGMVGASGAIFGILVAFGLLFPEMEMLMFPLPVPIKAKYMMILYIVIELFAGVYRIPGDSVAHFAHLGGALFGFILLKGWRIGRRGGY
jgi:membrane associated rhomboid family serine protease